MKPVILYRRRGGSEDEAELDAARDRFDVITQRTQAHDVLVVGRYSVLPFYRELEADLLAARARLINTAAQHDYVADIRNWYADLGACALTPKTWFRLEDVDANGPYVLKGSTNSRKNDWSTHMFAPTRADAGAVYSRLAADGLIGTQDIVIRKFEPLVTYGHAIGGVPISKEFRVFVCQGQIVASGYYWESFLEDAGLSAAPVLDASANSLVSYAIEKIGDRCAFYALDIAQREDGVWIVIELNDGQMSGLTGIAPGPFYARLAAILSG